MQRIIIAVLLLSTVINSSRASFMNVISVKGNMLHAAEHFFLQPHSYMTVTGEVTSHIENRIQNGSFEDGLSHWNISGDVALISSDEFSSPEDGRKMVRIGQSQNLGRPSRLNVLSQQIPAGVQSLSFYYNLFTYAPKGFADPGFMVFANDELIYQKWASEVVKNDNENQISSLSNSGWQYVSLNLSKYTEGTTLTLAFYAGNENLNLPVTTPHQTWVYVDNFSTNQVIANTSSTFEIHATEGTTVQYQLGSDPQIRTENPFHLNADTKTITYWSKNSHNTESKNTFFVELNDKKPEPVSDLQVLKEENNQFLLTWTVPSGTHLSSYDIRYAIKENTPWSDMQPVTIITEDGLPFGGYRSPRPEGEEEQYFIRVERTSSQYYFAIKVKDEAGNESVISPPAFIHLDSEPILDNSKDVVINEFTKTWVELYNKSSIAIDVNGWEIDEFPSQMKMSIHDQPLLKPHGYLPIPLDVSFTTQMNDVIQLISKKKSTADRYQIQFSVTDAQSFGREIDGIGDFIATFPTPGTGNVILKADLKPSLVFELQTPTSLRFRLKDAQNYSQGHYTIEYVNQKGVENGIKGLFTISPSTTEKNSIPMETCSSNGECIPDENVNRATIRITVTLNGDGIPERTLVQHLDSS